MREKIAARIRALRAKTVANGCTEDEAIAAAAKVAELLERYNMTVDEAELRESAFEKREEAYTDHVGERVLWKVAAAVAKLTGTRYYTSVAGVYPVTITFFGFAHEVEIASYLLDICANAMRREQARILMGAPRAVTPRQRNRLFPFLDGMADRLHHRIIAMIPPTPTGTGLIVLRNELIERALEDEGIKVKSKGAAASRSGFASYEDGKRAGDAVGLNPGVRGPDATRARLS